LRPRSYKPHSLIRRPPAKLSCIFRDIDDVMTDSCVDNRAHLVWPVCRRIYRNFTLVTHRFPCVLGAHALAALTSLFENQMCCPEIDLGWVPLHTLSSFRSSTCCRFPRPRPLSLSLSLSRRRRPFRSRMCIYILCTRTVVCDKRDLPDRAIHIVRRSVSRVCACTRVRLFRTREPSSPTPVL
jgi:hypothetical protein